MANQPGLLGASDGLRRARGLVNARPDDATTAASTSLLLFSTNGPSITTTIVITVTFPNQP